MYWLSCRGRPAQKLLGYEMSWIIQLARATRNHKWSIRHPGAMGFCLHKKNKGLTHGHH